MKVKEGTTQREESFFCPADAQLQRRWHAAELARCSRISRTAVRQSSSFSWTPAATTRRKAGASISTRSPAGRGRCRPLQLQERRTRLRDAKAGQGARRLLLSRAARTQGRGAESQGRGDLVGAVRLRDGEGVRRGAETDRRRRAANAARDQEPHRQDARSRPRGAAVLPRTVGGVLRRLERHCGRHARRASCGAIGTFYDKNNLQKASFVNGVVKGNRIDFYPDPKLLGPGTSPITCPRATRT